MIFIEHKLKNENEKSLRLNRTSATHLIDVDLDIELIDMECGH